MDKKGISSGMAVWMVIAFIGIGIAGFALYNNKTQLSVTTVAAPTASGTGVDLTCPYQPTATISGVDKYVATTTGFGNRYKLNGAPSTTYTAAFNVQKGDKVSILYAGLNTTYAPTKVDTTVEKCGINTFTNDQLVRLNNMTITCFNEEGNLIDDTSENETIGTGEAPTLKCEIRGAANTGIDKGAVLIADLPGATYKENEIAVTGLGSIPDKSSLFGDPVSGAIAAHNVATAGNKVRGFEVEPILGATVKTFYIYIPAETASDPGITDDIKLLLYPVGCYDEEDVTGGEFRCGTSDMDNTPIVGVYGAEYIQTD